MSETLTQRRRERLALAIVESVDEHAEVASFGVVLFSGFIELARALRDVPAGTELPSEVPNGTDGTTSEERVALALDFYGI